MLWSTGKTMRICGESIWAEGTAVAKALRDEVLKCALIHRSPSCLLPVRLNSDGHACAQLWTLFTGHAQPLLHLWPLPLYCQQLIQINLWHFKIFLTDLSINWTIKSLYIAARIPFSVCRLKQLPSKASIFPVMTTPSKHLGSELCFPPFLPIPICYRDLLTFPFIMFVATTPPCPFPKAPHPSLRTDDLKFGLLLSSPTGLPAPAPLFPTPNPLRAVLQ